MPITIDYYLSLNSPWTYIGSAPFAEIAKRNGVTVNVKPAKFGPIFEQTGGLPLPKRSPQRRAYRMMELKRWRDFLGMPLNLEPKFFPVPAEAAATLILAVLEQRGTETALDVAGDCLRAIWTEDRDISSRDTLRDIAGARGLDAQALLTQAASAGIAAVYVMQSQEAIARGIFGSPTYTYNDEIFWGQDRLDFLDRALARA